MLIYTLTTVSNFLINAKDGVINYNSSNKDSETNAENSNNSKDDKLAPT